MNFLPSSLFFPLWPLNGFKATFLQTTKIFNNYWYILIILSQIEKKQQNASGTFSSCIFLWVLQKWCFSLRWVHFNLASLTAFDVFNHMCHRAEPLYTVPKSLSQVHHNDDGTMKAASMKKSHHSECQCRINLMNLMSQEVSIGSKIGT